MAYALPILGYVLLVVAFIVGGQLFVAGLDAVKKKRKTRWFGNELEGKRASWFSVMYVVLGLAFMLPVFAVATGCVGLFLWTFLGHW